VLIIPRRNLIRAVKKAIGQPRYAMKAFGQRAKSFPELSSEGWVQFISGNHFIIPYVPMQLTMLHVRTMGDCGFFTGIAPGSLKIRTFY